VYLSMVKIPTLMELTRHAADIDLLAMALIDAHAIKYVVG